MAHYFDQEPDVAADERLVTFSYADKEFVFHSSAGVFSKNHLDDGSRALLDGVRKFFTEQMISPEGSLLDLGCGYGVIGIVLKRLYPKLTLVLADINERAVALAKSNTRENRIGYTEVLQSDGWRGLQGRSFDWVVTNPPIRAGKKTVYAFFAGAADQLNTGGRFFTVVAKHQGADSAKKELQRLFGHCEVVSRSKGFHVLMAQKTAAQP